MIRCDDDDVIECPPCPSPGGDNGAVAAAVIGALGGILAASLPSLLSMWQSRREHQDNLLATAVRAEALATRAEDVPEESAPKPRRRRA